MSDDFRSLFDDDEPEEKKDQPADDTPEWQRDAPGKEQKRPDSLGFTGELHWRQPEDPFARMDAEQSDETFDWQTEQPAPAGSSSGLTGQLSWLQGDEETLPEPSEEQLLDWMQEETPGAAESEADSGWVETPAQEERPSAGEYDLPPWLMGADNAEDQGMFLDETGRLSEAWLKTGDNLPETVEADMTYDEWMAQKAAAQRPPDLEAEVPDLPLGEEAVGEVKGTDELPDWYQGMEKLDESEAPDWFRDEQASPTSEPDLLSEFDLEQSIASSGAAPAPAEDDLLPEFTLEQSMESPDWAAQPGEEDLAQELTLEQSIAGQPEIPAEDELPDWLMGDELAQEEALEESMTGEMPDWLARPSADDLLAELDLEQSIAETPQDWFAEAEPAASDQPEWLQQLGEISAAETIMPGAQEAPPGAADFLAELQAASGDLDSPAFQDIDSLLASMDSEAKLPDTGDLLLDPNPDIDDVFAESMLGVAEPPKPDLPSDAPDWLTELGATVGKVSAAAIVRQRKDRPLEELPQRLQNLHERGEELAAPDLDADEELSTLSTLLPGVPQVLPPARLRPGLPSMTPDVVLTDAQRQRVNLLKTLVAADEEVERTSAIDRTYDSPFMEGLLEEEAVAEAPAVEEAPAPRPRPRRRLKVDRFIISLLVAAGVILPFYVNQLRLGDLPPAGFAAGSMQQAAFDQVNAAQDGDLALVAVEYSPTGAGELDSLTDALLRHLFTRGARPVLVSSNPVGLLHGNNVLDAINADQAFLARVNRSQPFEANEDYFVVRYLAGNVVGLRGFGQNAGQYLTSDIRGQATNLAVNSLSDFALLVVIAERADDVRAWAEQVVPRAGAPVVYATGFSAAPLAEPYVQSQTDAGLLVGYRDAYTYNILLDPSLAPAQAPTTAPTEVEPEVAPTATPIAPTDVPPTEAPAIEPTEAQEGIAPQQEASPTIEPSPIPVTATSAPTEAQPTAAQQAEASNTPAPTATPTQLPVLTGVVDAQQTINVRQGPGTNNPVITTLEPGTEVRVLGRNSDGSWINIQLDDGTEGWVAEELLDIQEPQSSGDKLRIYARALAQEATPTPEGAPTAEATAEVPAASAGSDPLAAVASTSYRDERWYGMTFGLVVIVVIIALGSVVNVLRGLFGRRQR